MGKNLGHMGTAENFLKRTPKAYSLRTRIGKCDHIKLQIFCKAKDMVNRTKWKKKNILGKILTNPTSYKRLMSNVYKELKKLDSRESNNPIKNGVQS